MTALRVGQVMMWNGSLWVNAEIGEARQIYSVLDYGAEGDGVTDDSEAFDDAATAAAATGGTVYVPEGSYLVPTFEHPSGVTVEGAGDSSVILNCYWTATGTAGSEIAFTGAAAAMATSISIPSTGLTDSWLRISSVINSQSTDAGEWQLGHVTSQESYLAEFVRIKTAGASSATLYGPILFPYSNTPGSDTYASFLTSVARVVTFNEGATIRNMKFRGKNSSQNSIILTRWARGFTIENCTIDSDDSTAQNVRFEYSLDCHIRASRLVGRRNSVPAGSTANPLIFASSQLCSAHECTIEYGNQGVDITYADNDATYRGGPCIACGVSDSRSYYAATDGFTSHQGCWASYFDTCTTINAVNGVRIRSRHDRVTGCILLAGGNVGVGVKINAGAVVQSIVESNTIDGYLHGVELVHETDEAGYDDLTVTLGRNQCEIKHNRISNSGDHAIYINTAPTSSASLGPSVTFNEIRAATSDPIAVNAYNNGTIISENRIHGVASGKGGIQWGANIQRLHIGDNHIYGVPTGAVPLRGFSVVSFMTDATTVPAGEAEAELHIGKIYTDSTADFSGILRVPTAYAPARVAGYQPFISPFGNTVPTLQRSSVGMWQDGERISMVAQDKDGVSRRYIAVYTASGTPEGSVTAPVGSLYTRTNGASGTVLYIKEDGTGATGWRSV
jgi:hypothetical protein